MAKRFPSIEKVVDAYIACGKKLGFFYAELILMKYLPDENPEGMCFNVPAADRAEFIRELKNTTLESLTQRSPQSQENLRKP